MKILNRILIILMTAITICTIIFDIRISKVFICLSLIPTILIPTLCKKIKIKLNDLDITIYYLFLLVVQVLGHICNLYNTIWWFDIFAHFISGIFSFYLGLILLKNWNITEKENFVFHLFFCICLSALIALSWEIIEFIIDCLFKLNNQHSLDTGISDTMQDMIIAMIGSIISVIYYYMKNKKYIISKF